MTHPIRLLTALLVTLLLVAGCKRAPPATPPPAAVAAAPEAARTPAAPQRPHVIVIVADDLGYADTSTYAPQGVPTPQLDRLAASGIRFSAGYVSAPVCGPSRAGLMTGRHPQRYGFEYNVGGHQVAHDEARGLPPTEITLGDAMRAAGYQTALLGKWHLGSTDAQYPTSRGFDRFYGILPGATPYADPDLAWVVNANSPPVELESGATFTPIQPGPRSSWNEVIRGPERKVVDNFDRYLTDDLTDRAIQYIETSDTAPFFLLLSYTAPHAPFQAPQAVVDRFPNIADPVERVHAAMIASLDDNIGRVLDTLDTRGLAENTLVFFLSDNGCANLASFCHCEPVRGYKTSHLEGGIRVPFLVRWPAKLGAGIVYDRPVISHDVFPTVVAAAGGTLDPGRTYDGVDLVPHLISTSGQAAGKPHAALHWRTLPQKTVRAESLKMRIARSGIPKLFDLAVDPLELTDIAETHPGDVQDLQANFGAWESQMIPPAWPPGEDDNADNCGESIPFTP